ncbi:MAG: nucleotidyltransferase domain-containing protein [Hydrogenothermaceae bacterium]|nr:nucleotidyltransferase domain-containing protein [Hydrogenothermaceae bacterium]
MEKIYTIEQLKEFIRNFLSGKDIKVYLFGSRARGNNRESSDIDLAFESEEDIDRQLTYLRFVIEESNLPYKVDIVNLKYAPYLKDVIEREGERWI